METNKYKNLVTELRNLKEQKEKKNEEIKAINSSITQVENMLISELQTDGLDTIKVSGIGTVYITTTDYPQVTDMDSFVKWCAENNRADMIQKRVSSTAFKQYVEEFNEYPDGVDSYVKETVNLRRN